jgi:hypothetical protein
MVDPATRFGIVLGAIFLLEVSVAAWLQPLGTSPAGTLNQRLCRFYIPPVALALLLALLRPPSTKPDTIAQKHDVVIFTAVLAAMDVLGAVVIAIAWRKRTRPSEPRRQLRSRRRRVA